MTAPKDEGGEKVQVVDGVFRSVPWAGSIELRDYFAAAALTGILANIPHNGDFTIEVIRKAAVEEAFAIADAALSERNRKP